MARREYGKVVEWNKNKRYGTIRGERTGQRYGFQQRDTPREMKVKVDMQVEFEVVRYRGREVARHVSAVSPFPHGYRFHNPYNFVRPMRDVDRSQFEDINVQLLGRMAPPPHDRYLGLSGRITCRLETVTPLFVSSAENVTKDPEQSSHHHYEFFKLGTTKAIPASTLRGAIRNIYEIATNSSFSNLTGNRLSYRLPSDEVQKMVPARIEQGEGEDRNWYLRLLPGTAPFDVSQGQKKGLYAAPVRFYEACRSSSRRGNGTPKSPIADAPNGFEHGTRYWAVLVKVKFPPSWRVLGLYASQQEAEQARRQFEMRSETRVRQGWLCKTNQNTDNKSNERFFFCEPGRRDGVPKRLNLGEEHPALTNYLDLIVDYQDRHAKDVAKRSTPSVADCKEQPIAFSRHVLVKKERKLDEPGWCACLCTSKRCPKQFKG